jgi:hypothetical protein
MKHLAFVVVMLLLPCIGVAQTLCRTGEMDYFSCETTANRKIVSICGNITNGEIDSESWLQYRFGKKGAIELSYPQDTSGSVEKFEGNYFGRYGVADLRFIAGRTLYGVALNLPYDGDEAQRRKKSSGNISVTLGKSKHVRIGCTKISNAQLFIDLNIWLRAHNGETDFLYYFFNHVAE